MRTLPSLRVRFGAFEFDLSTGELQSTETPDPRNKVLLREQVFQVLRMPVERGGKIVTCGDNCLPKVKKLSSSCARSP